MSQRTLNGGKSFPHLADLTPLIPICRQQLVVLPGTLLATGFDFTHSVLRYGLPKPHVRLRPESSSRLHQIFPPATSSPWHTSFCSMIDIWGSLRLIIPGEFEETILGFGIATRGLPPRLRCKCSRFSFCVSSPLIFSIPYIHCIFANDQKKSAFFQKKTI